MSGYRIEEGVFELTGSKAHYWLRRTSFPTSCEGLTGMALYAELLRFHGHEITKLETSYLHVRATPGQVWEALSGQPSDPARERHYLRNPAPGGAAKPAATSEAVRLLPEGALMLFRTGIDGSGVPLANAIASGRGTCRVCGKVVAKGVVCIQGDWDFNDGRGGFRPTRCYLHRECLGPATIPHATD